MKGENNQNLGRTLPLNESRMTKKQFINFLMKSQELDPENFLLGNVVIDGDDGPVNWPVVIGEHVLKRVRQRTFMLPSDAMRKVIRLLSIPYVGQMVTEYQVVWDEDAMEAVDFNEDGILATIIKDEASHMFYAFECGLSYIRLKSLWIDETGETFDRDKRAFARITEDGVFIREA